MKIRHIGIKNFRGIKELDWKIAGDFICLIGAGDSTKSTILEAIEYALSPRWNITFEDTDFYDLDVNQKIEINLTFGQFADEFLSDQKYGQFLRGWSVQDGFNDEPKESDEIVLTLSLQVTKDFEPKWLIVNDRLLDEKRMSSSDRALLGMSYLGAYTGRHLSWSSGSALSAMTGEELKLNQILAEAARNIRDKIDLSSLEDITRVVNEAERLGKSVGVVPRNGIKANVDIKRFTIKESGVALHDGNVPLRLSGNGTQRLMGMALQLGLIGKGGINLIDEIEYGLEPHRIAQILSLLKNNMSEKGQVFLTTHSPCVLQELDVSNLRIVDSEKGMTTVKMFEDDSRNNLQRLVRNSPHAFLAKKIIVCEGKTEEGVLRGLDSLWQNEDKRGIWSYGAVSVCGGGDDKSFNVAAQFKVLKYEVIWWGDSDNSACNAAKEEVKKLGIPVIDWADSSNIELRLFLDLPWGGVKELLLIAADIYGLPSIVGQVKNLSGVLSEDVDKWTDSQDLRSALADAAHKKEWFKNITYAEKVGDVVAKHWNTIASSDLYKKLLLIKKWVETGEYSGALAS